MFLFRICRVLSEEIIPLEVLVVPHTPLPLRGTLGGIYQLWFHPYFTVKIAFSGYFSLVLICSVESFFFFLVSAMKSPS